MISFVEKGMSFSHPLEAEVDTHAGKALELVMISSKDLLVFW